MVGGGGGGGGGWWVVGSSRQWVDYNSTSFKITRILRINRSNVPVRYGQDIQS